MEDYEETMDVDDIDYEDDYVDDFYDSENDDYNYGDEDEDEDDEDYGYESEDDDFEEDYDSDEEEITKGSDFDEDDSSITETLEDEESSIEFESSEDSSSDDIEEQMGTLESMSESLRKDYDNAFTGEEKTQNLLKISSDKFKLEPKLIKISEIGISEPAKLGRQKTMIGLTQAIRDMGVLTPIHVMKVADEDASDDYRYVLIDGLRRIFGAVKNGVSEILAIVWDFKDKERGMELVLPLSLMLNRQQNRKWGEVWDLYQILELQSAITPGTLEYLLQLEAGEAMRLKDVMLCDYSEVKEALLSGEKNLDGCYKLLQKLRKEEDQLGKDDATGFGDTVETAEEVTESTSEKAQLSDTDVLELLEMVDDMDSDDVTSEDFSSMNEVDDSFVEQQKVGERHPLDPALRQAVLVNDDFTCRCCGTQMKGARLGLIAVHHALPVHTGGKDTLDNLMVLCLNCHTTLHILERNGGSIMMNQEDFNDLLPSEQTALKRALKLAKIAIEADKRKGLSKEQVMEKTKDAIRHPMPTIRNEDKAAYNSVKAKEMLDAK